MARRHQGGQGGADRLRVVEPAHQFADELQLPLARAPLRDDLRRSYRSQQIFRQRHPPQLCRSKFDQLFPQILQGGGLPLALAFARRSGRFRVIRFFIEVVVVHDGSLYFVLGWAITIRRCVGIQLFFHTCQAPMMPL